MVCLKPEYASGDSNIVWIGFEGSCPEDILANDEGRRSVRVLRTANCSFMLGLSQLLQRSVYGVQLVPGVDLGGSSHLVDYDCIQPHPNAERLQGSERISAQAAVAQYLVL